MNRRSFFKTTAAGTLGVLLAETAHGTGAGASRPNIIFVMADDHASHALSCYGSVINKTPHLDRIAEEGMRFENCFVTNSICAPSRAVLLTGKYSHLNGVPTNRERFDGGQQTFPKLLRAAGYQTALVGKWHLKSEPTGFDYWNILTGQGVYHDPTFIEMGERKRHRGYVTDLITDFAMDFLERRDREKPFCLLFHHKAPHRRWFPDDKHAHLYEVVDIPEPATFNDDYATRGTAAHTQEMTVEFHLTPEDLKQEPPEGLSGAALKHWKYERYIKDYLRCIASIDDNMGRFLDYLDRSGLAENTIIIYTSDQGFYLGDHGWFDKRFMYEESLRTPMIARFPGRIKAGTVCGKMVLNLDWAPTLLDVAGVEIPDDMQGKSLVPLMEGRRPRDWRSSFYYQYTEYPSVHAVRRHYGVRTKRYKLIHFYHDMDEWELYDLKKDPHELKNIYGKPGYARITAGLKRELTRLRKELKVPAEG